MACCTQARLVSTVGGRASPSTPLHQLLLFRAASSSSSSTASLTWNKWTLMQLKWVIGQGRGLKVALSKFELTLYMYPFTLKVHSPLYLGLCQFFFTNVHIQRDVATFRILGTISWKICQFDKLLSMTTMYSLWEITISNFHKLWNWSSLLRKRMIDPLYLTLENNFIDKWAI